jgi:predicted dithiol-disulfide oxidoreductase (DUF899 family)
VHLAAAYGKWGYSPAAIRRGWSLRSCEPSRDALVAGRWFGMIVCYLRDDDRVFETYWTTGRATEAMGSVYGLLDMTVYGRQETFEDSPPGWPQFWRNTGEHAG